MAGSNDEQATVEVCGYKKTKETYFVLLKTGDLTEWTEIGLFRNVHALKLFISFLKQEEAKHSKLSRILMVPGLNTTLRRFKNDEGAEEKTATAKKVVSQQERFNIVYGPKSPEKIRLSKTLRYFDVQKKLSSEVQIKFNDEELCSGRETLLFGDVSVFLEKSIELSKSAPLYVMLQIVTLCVMRPDIFRANVYALSGFSKKPSFDACYSEQLSKRTCMYLINSSYATLVAFSSEIFNRKFGFKTENDSLIVIRVPSKHIATVDIEMMQRENKAAVDVLANVEQSLSVNYNEFKPTSEVVYLYYGPSSTYVSRIIQDILGKKLAKRSHSLTDGNINTVIVHKSYIQYLHLIPILDDLRAKNVSFYVSGIKTDDQTPHTISFKRIYPRGGIITLSNNYIYSDLTMFLELVKTVSASDSWSFRIPSRIYSSFLTLINKRTNSLEYEGLCYIRDQLSQSVLSGNTDTEEDYLRSIEFKYLLQYRYYYILDSENNGRRCTAQRLLATVKEDLGIKY